MWINYGPWVPYPRPVHEDVNFPPFDTDDVEIHFSDKWTPWILGVIKTLLHPEVVGTLFAEYPIMRYSIEEILAQPLQEEEVPDVAPNWAWDILSVENGSLGGGLLQPPVVGSEDFFFNVWDAEPDTGDIFIGTIKGVSIPDALHVGGEIKGFTLRVEPPGAPIVCQVQATDCFDAVSIFTDISGITTVPNGEWKTFRILASPIGVFINYTLQLLFTAVGDWTCGPV